MTVIWSEYIQVLVVIFGVVFTVVAGIGIPIVVGSMIMDWWENRE